MNKDKFSLFLAAFLIVGMFFLALPEEGLAQGGCCRTPDNLSCLGCDSDCAATESFCEAQGGIFIGGQEACVDPFGDCGSAPDTTGCCLIVEGVCGETRTFDECFQGDVGQFWVADEACSEVPECDPITRNIPTLSEWGLLSLAVVLGILGIAGFMIRRRKAAI